MLNMESTVDLEFCPVPESERALHCRLVEGQIVSVDRPCPHRKDCCQLLTDLAASYAAVILAKDF